MHVHTPVGRALPRACTTEDVDTAVAKLLDAFPGAVLVDVEDVAEGCQHVDASAPAVEARNPPHAHELGPVAVASVVTRPVTTLVPTRTFASDKAQLPGFSLGTNDPKAARS